MKGMAGANSSTCLLLQALLLLLVVVAEMVVQLLLPWPCCEPAGGVTVRLTPERYLFLVASGWYCLGVFDNGRQGTLLGGNIVRNVLVQVRASICSDDEQWRPFDRHN
jgi:hypothetical protein